MTGNDMVHGFPWCNFNIAEIYELDTVAHNNADVNTTSNTTICEMCQTKLFLPILVKKFTVGAYWLVRMALCIKENLSNY